MARRRRSGMGLGGLLIIAALLYFTGAGKWLWARALELEGQCYGMLSQIGTTMGNGLCAGMGSVIRSVDGVFVDAENGIARFTNTVYATLNSATLPSSVGDLRLTPALAKLGSTKDQLAERMQLGPQSLASDASSVRDQIRSAVDSFAIGKNYLAGTGSSVTRAIPWLQQGAQVPGYGVLSQLSLGDLFSGATSDRVGVDRQAAVGYYTQAYYSIDQLQAADTTEARKILQALPASPEALKAQLRTVIAQLKTMPSQTKQQ